MEVMILRRRRAHSVLRQMSHGAVRPVLFHRCAQLNQAEHSLRLGRTWSLASSMFASARKLLVVRLHSLARWKAAANDKSSSTLGWVS
jgi:hypothetical protein